MKFTSTKGMTPDTAPQGDVLAYYLYPFFGMFAVAATVAYFDNPNDYGEDYDDGGWKEVRTGQKINVVSYAEIPEPTAADNPYRGMTQEEFYNTHAATFPNLGCVGV